MIDLTWKVFSQTGSIETYLLMKELEDDQPDDENQVRDKEEITPAD